MFAGLNSIPAAKIGRFTHFGDTVRQGAAGLPGQQEGVQDAPPRSDGGTVEYGRPLNATSLVPLAPAPR